MTRNGRTCQQFFLRLRLFQSTLLSCNQPLKLTCLHHIAFLSETPERRARGKAVPRLAAQQSPRTPREPKTLMTRSLSRRLRTTIPNPVICDSVSAVVRVKQTLARTLFTPKYQAIGVLSCARDRVEASSMPPDILRLTCLLGERHPKTLPVALRHTDSRPVRRLGRTRYPYRMSAKPDSTHDICPSFRALVKETRTVQCVRSMPHETVGHLGISRRADVILTLPTVYDAISRISRDREDKASLVLTARNAASNACM